MEQIKARRVRIVLVKCELAAGDEVHVVLPDALDNLEKTLTRDQLKAIEGALSGGDYV